MTSRSKNFYQGMNLKRVHRSEFDDAKLRDLARQDARLGQEMKTVERARNVMLKSMDADKQLFIKAGAQANSKMTRSIQGNWPRSNSQPPPQHSRLVSDSRTKKTSVPDNGDTNGNRNPSGSKSDKQRSGSESGSSANHEQTPEQLTPDAVSSLYDTSSIYDKFFEANTGKLSSSAKALGHDQDAKSAKMGTSSSSTKLGGSGRGMTVISESDGRAPESTHRTTKHAYSPNTEHPHPHKSNEKDHESATNSSRHKEINGDDRVHSNGAGSEADMKSHTEDGKDTKGSTPTRRTGAVSMATVSMRDQDEETGKRQTIWEALSTPKHTSMAKSKRSQIEKEFGTPTLKNSTSSPALLSMAKTSSTTKSKPRRSSQTGSGSHQGRQVDGVKGRQLSSSKLRNDT